MKNLFNLLFLVLVMTLVSCSSSSSQKEENKVESMMDDSVALEDEFDEEEGTEEESFTQDTIEERDDEVVAENNFENRQLDEQQEMPAQVEPTESSQLAQYTIQNGDTLMLISFKIYGDYSKWRELAQGNPQLTSFQSLTAGEVVNYEVPSEQFNWRPEGDSYLIKRNDTLGTISQDLYNTTSKWRMLYEHNKPLIKDPNMIFAGFTIYYMPWNEEGRDLANQ